jgi:hypothetical protein
MIASVMDEKIFGVSYIIHSRMNPFAHKIFWFFKIVFDN